MNEMQFLTRLIAETAAHTPLPNVADCAEMDATDGIAGRGRRPATSSGDDTAKLVLR